MKKLGFAKAVIEATNVGITNEDTHVNAWKTFMPSGYGVRGKKGDGLNAAFLGFYKAIKSDDWQITMCTLYPKAAKELAAADAKE